MSDGNPAGGGAGPAVGSRDRIRLLSSALLLVLGVSLALQRYFICDDAFISFRYARNLARGLGLVFNPGERVEGYTNLLWTLLMVPAFPFGIDARVWSAVLAYAFFGGALVLLWRASEATARERSPGTRPFVSLALAGTVLNHSVLNWASGGLETALVLFLTLILIVLYPPAAATGRGAAAGLSLGAALLVLARPDGLLLAFVFVGCLLLVRTPGRSPAAGLREAITILVPGGAVLGLTAAWKLGYYGHLLPNTYYAKNAGVPHWDQGLAYVGAFFRSYPPLVLALLLPGLALLALVKARRGGRLAVVADPLFPSCLGAAAFLVYAARVGGDFMGYRLLVPVVPLFYFALERVLVSRVRDMAVWSVAAAALLGVLMLRDVRVLPGGKMETRQQLQFHIDGQRWDLMGLDLARRLPPDTVIATTASGALPYYYEGRTVDLLGLTDRHIAHLDMDMSLEGATIGHCKFADDAYLLSQGVSFSFEWIQGPESFSAAYPARPDEVMVRLREDYALRGRYLHRTAALDALLRNRPGDFKVVEAVTPRGKGFLPPEVRREGEVVGFVDVRGDPSTGPLTLLDRHGNRVTDEGRLAEEHSLELPPGARGAPLRLVLRSYFLQAAEIAVEVDGRRLGVLTAPPTRGGFDYLELVITPSEADGSNRAILSSQGAPFAPYAFWWLRDPGPA
jgi:arabinofuranosyltransferase